MFAYFKQFFTCFFNEIVSETLTSAGTLKKGVILISKGPDFIVRQYILSKTRNLLTTRMYLLYQQEGFRCFQLWKRMYLADIHTITHDIFTSECILPPKAFIPNIKTRENQLRHVRAHLLHRRQAKQMSVRICPIVNDQFIKRSIVV